MVMTIARLHWQGNISFFVCDVYVIDDTSVIIVVVVVVVVAAVVVVVVVAGLRQWQILLMVVLQ